MRPRAIGPLGAGLLLVVAGCAETTFEPSATTSDATTTTLAVDVTGTRSDLLGRLDGELAALSERITESEGQTQALERIESLWAALRADLALDRPELVPGFQAVVDLAARAVARRRPADADKARLNLQALLTAAE